MLVTMKLMRSTIIVLALFVALFLLPGDTRADEVSLQTGSVVIQGLTVTVSLPGLGLSYTGTGSSGNFFALNTISNGSGQLGNSRLFTGSGSFSDSLLTGSVTAFGPDATVWDPGSPLFTVNFRGSGFVTAIPGGTRFTITSPTPEPATMLLLGTGLAGVAASLRRRRKAPGEPEASRQAGL